MVSGIHFVCGHWFHAYGERGLLFYSVSHVQILGNPLSQELSVAPRENGVVLKYHPEPRRSIARCSDLGGEDGSSPSNWHNFATRIWQSGTGRGIGWNQALLSRLLFGPPLQLLEEDDDGDIS
jgi:hypothetical protein